MITLLTGGTGDGKTALAVSMMIKEYAGRPLFVGGVKELKVDHFPVPVTDEWTEEVPIPEDPSLSEYQFRFPENAVIILDEAQRYFRPRHATSKVPPEVQAFETHRHEGIDWVLITQSPSLIDSNVRKLVKRHIHIWDTPLGKYRLEMPKPFDPDDKSQRDIAARTRYAPPKEVFGLYKSSRAHTKVKRSIPRYIWVFAAASVAFVAFAWQGYNAINSKVSSAPSAAMDSMKHLGEQRPSSHKTTGEVLTKAEYLTTLQPRIPGLYHTAPRYDEVTKPTDAPWPSICVDSAAWNNRPARCRCLDQQGNDYNMPDGACRQIAKAGIFKDWGKERDGRPEADRPDSTPQQANRTQSAEQSGAVKIPFNG